MPHLRQQLETALGASYTVERELGGGGMSRVFVAEETRLGRKVVIKLLPPELGEGLSAERFEREIRVAAGLQDPHIVPVIAAGVAAGLPYYTMPFMEGQSLRTRLSGGDVPLAEALSILTDVATALEYAHDRGIVHRDIKPENILLSKRSAVVTDFGIAKAVADSRLRGTNPTLTAIGSSLGTPPYMAPEQIAAEPDIDQRADLYALGVLAYEIFTGSTPFAGRSQTKLIAAIMSEMPQPLSLGRPDLPAALTELVMRLLAKDRMARPSSAAEVLRDLDGIARTAGPDSRTLTVRRRRYAAGAIAAAVLLAATVFTVRSRQAAQPEQEPAFWLGGEARSVAVLPFSSIRGDTVNEHFAEGLTDELISVLSRVHGLRVIARTSTFRLSDMGLSIRAIADTLGVETVVDGNVRRAGGRIKATAHLVRASDGTILWTGDFDRESSDIFRLQEEIASAIVDSLHVRRDPRTRGPIFVQPTRDLVAYDLYLAARRSWAVRTPEGLDSAAKYLQRATARDSGFAVAFAALSDIYVVKSNFRFMPLDSALRLAEAAADRAIALDNSLGEAHTSKAFVLMSRGSFEASEASFQRAIRLNPSNAMARHFHSLLLTMQGKQEEAERENAQALLLDPLLPPANAQRGILLSMRGDYPAARLALRASIALSPGFQLPLLVLGLLDAADGRYDDALASLEQAHERAPNFPSVRSGLAYTYTRVGQPARARAVLATLGTKRDDDRVERALAEAIMGNLDVAFATIGKSRWDMPTAINIQANPLLSSFKRDPRYIRLLQERGLRP